jgi:tetratricopeptide (TPR) repeat protein
MSAKTHLIAGALVLATIAATASAAANDKDACYKESGDVAIAACNRAITSSSYNGRDLAGLYINRGYEYKQKKDYDHAIQDYDQAIKINPNFAQAFNNRGVVYYFKGQYDRAIRDYDQAIKIDPNTVSAAYKPFYSRGLVYYHKGQYDRAIQDFDQAIKRDPNHTDAIKYRAEAMAKKNKQ